MPFDYLLRCHFAQKFNTRSMSTHFWHIPLTFTLSHTKRRLLLLRFVLRPNLMSVTTSSLHHSYLLNFRISKRKGLWLKIKFALIADFESYDNTRVRGCKSYKSVDSVPRTVTLSTTFLLKVLIVTFPREKLQIILI